MAEGDSPTVARRRVRLAIREAREAAELLQSQVAEEMEWSLSKVIRIENGDVSISINDLRGLLGLFGVRDKETVNALLADARIARTRNRPQPSWWQEPRFRDQMSDSLRVYIEYECEASEIRSFAIYYLPGVLQTPEYGAALTGMWLDEEPGFTQEKIDTLIEARRLRHEALIARAGSVRVYLVLDESVLHRPIGGPGIFAGQLRLLLDLSARGILKIRMLPYDLNVAIANNGSFDLMLVGADREAGEVLYRENGTGDEMIEDRRTTRRHRARFEQLWQAASTESDTIKFIKQRIAALEARVA
ncbi:transcriptional regulator [Paractinoplanes deccanensis]|uniref:Transcriptional regulator n=1 Tax=Paractinoplanes deccanensis TaxID=113561 RepID=A0ABQ3YCX9_9ACTN|nr:helix-turn-helix transcriptional regulator [Actinoplanes deccanensis]GID77855.1 transcriptional regulator [Actinoplanes deccanensis]